MGCVPTAKEERERVAVPLLKEPVPTETPLS
jgi:hypothetical protein